jgi:hypothetical protein
MNNTEAKFILNAYRSNGRDASDAAFGAALLQAKTDPALGAWFAREQEHGATIAAKLREVSPPAGLREAILAGGRVSGSNVTMMPDQRSRWAQPVWLAAAAAVAVILTASVALWPKRVAGEAPLAEFALADALEPSRHRGHGEMAGALQATLSNSATKLTGGLPIDFAALRSNGCRTVSVAGHDVLEVCFKRDGQWFHCYIARVEDFPGAPAAVSPLFARTGRVDAAVWVDGAYRVLVATTAGHAAVQRLL